MLLIYVYIHSTISFMFRQVFFIDFIERYGIILWKKIIQQRTAEH